MNVAETELGRRMGWPEGRHQSVGKWPKWAHMIEHMSEKWKGNKAYRDENIAVAQLLLEPHPVSYIASTMGPAWTSRVIETRAERITETFALAGVMTHRRLALVALASGTAPCYCERT